jgi:RNA polymerase sigma-70 factor, ECF subfamily
MTEAERRQVHEAMVRLAEGDRDAFDVVFDRLWPRVRRFVDRGLPGHADADDVAQQTLVKLFARISEFDTSRDGVAWAFGIAGYEIRTARQQAARRREVETDRVADAQAKGASPEDAVIEADLRQALRDVLGDLSEQDRTALADDTPPTIAPATWRKRRQRALERLRHLWRSRHA